MMHWPSKRSLAIGTSSFVIGFAAAMALAGGFVAWVYTGSQSTRQDWIVDPLVSSVELLTIADAHPKQLTHVIVGNVRDHSLAASTQFDRLTKLNQKIVLRQFARLNQSAALHADNAPFAKTVRLARVMVLCSHASASPGWLTVDKNSGGMTPVPEWVLDPGAKPALPKVGSIVGTFQQSPTVIAAERKQWDKLHLWVAAHRTCIEREDATVMRNHTTTSAEARTGAG